MSKYMDQNEDIREVGCTGQNMIEWRTNDDDDDAPRIVRTDIFQDVQLAVK